MDRSPHDIATRAGRLREPERTRFVDDACAGDPALRRAVEQMLRLHESETIDASTTGRPHPRNADDGTLPDRVGAYRVFGRLGAGAMGVVYLAEQRHPKRRVALKVIRPEIMTPVRERRFDLEAEALARLRHPGIATIYEAGRAELDGRAHPFLAMELVQGLPLDVHAARLPPKERIALVASVCDAVEHAHARGILHRDLKPANILVDEEGRARVLDFGVARTVHTHSDDPGGPGRGELVGTVAYMSPEQLAADPDVDGRTDVYALGVILHEVLTGRRPHDVGHMTVDDALAVVANPPELDADALGPEPAAIIASAVHPDRDRRYATPGELAAELRRHLRHEPVEAMGGGAWYRGRKLARRHPITAGLAAAALVLLVGGVAGISWQAARATRGWTQARAETERAEAALGRVEAERRRVHALNVFMTNMLTSADPAVALGSELTVRELLDHTASNLSAELLDQPELAATVRMALANTYIALGEYASAERQSSTMLENCLRGLGGDHPLTADARRTLAQVFVETDRFTEAEALIHAAVPVIDAIGDRVESARVRGELARVLMGTGRQDEAFALWSASREELTSAIGPDAEYTLVMTHNLCMAMRHAGLLPEAEELAADLVERRRRVLGPDNPQTLAAMDLLGGLIMAQGREREAVDHLRAVLDGRSRVLGEHHISTLLTMGNLGATLIRLGELDEAETLTRRALEAHTVKFGREHTKTLILLSNLAYLLEERGRRDEAVDLYREIIAIRKRATGGLDPETWPSMNNLAMILSDLGRHDEADAIYTDLLGLCAQVVPDTHYVVAIFRNNHAACLTALGRFDDARAALAASHPVIVSFFGPDHERTRRSLDRAAALEAAAAQGRAAR